MSMYTPGNTNRPRRSERSRQLYEARGLPAYDGDPVTAAEDTDAQYYTPNEHKDGGMAAHEPRYEPDGRGSNSAFEYLEPADGGMAGYMPNEPEADNEQTHMHDGSTVDAPAALPAREDLSANLSAYYRRPSGNSEAFFSHEDESKYTYAPPLKINYAASDNAEPQWTDDEQPQDAYAPMNVYRPREVTWDETARRQALSAAHNEGYQVQDEWEAPAHRRRKRYRVRGVIVLVCVLAILGGGAYVFRDKLMEWTGELLGQPQGTSVPYAALTTPAPARGYDSATPIAVSGKAGGAISQISGTVEMEPIIVTDTSVVTRNQRDDGNYDFYLFSAKEGKLLAYFECLEADGIVPLPEGGFYLKQSPYLVNDTGSALIRTDGIVQMLSEAVRLYPMMNGWAMISNENQTLYNYVDSSGQLLSRLWFARAYPMTGRQSIAYVDTGNVTDMESRYALYLVDAEGDAVKWKDAPNMTELIASACGMAYMDSGELYRLDRPDAPLMITDDVTVYADCDSMVIKDQESGKYGLFVHGEQHYDFTYDSIEPVQCDIVWNRQAYRGDNGNFTLCTVEGAAYPQPLSHYFLLVKDGVEEYVALSTSSACPVVLE